MEFVEILYTPLIYVSLLDTHLWQICLYRTSRSSGSLSCFVFGGVPGSNLGPETSYPTVFYGFPQYLHATARIVFWIKAWPSFHMLSNSSFTYRFIWCYIVQVTENATLNKRKINTFDQKDSGQAETILGLIGTGFSNLTLQNPRWQWRHFSDAGFLIVLLTLKFKIHFLLFCET